MKSSEGVGWEGRPDLNCDFCVNCRSYGKLENSQKFAEPVKINRNRLFFAICAKFVNSVTGLWQRAAKITSIAKNCDLVNETENSGKSQFTRKFVNLTKNRKFYNERAKNFQSCSFFLRCFLRVRKISNFSTACKPSTKALSAILCLSVRRVPCSVELHSGTVLVLLSLLSLANRGCAGNWVKISPLKQFGSSVCSTPIQV